MKYLVPCLLLPLLTSCTVIQEEYYEPGYYYVPPHVEVQRQYPPTRYYNYNRKYHGHNGYRPAPRGRVYQGHPNSRGNTVFVNPRAPQPHVEVQQNVHGHGGNGGNVHSHGGNGGNVHGHAGNGGNVHGHAGNDGNVHGHTGNDGNVHGHTGNGGNVHGHTGSNGNVAVSQPQIPTVQMNAHENNKTNNLRHPG